MWFLPWSGKHLQLHPRYPDVAPVPGLWCFTSSLTTCAFGRGSHMYVDGQAPPQVCGHVAVRCRWGSNPAGPPTGRHCVPNSGRRCVRLTPCVTELQGPLNVELETCSKVGLVIVAATNSFCCLLGPHPGTFGRLGLSAGMCTRAGGCIPVPAVL